MIKAMRQVIHVNDIMVFFDKKERQSYKMIADIKKCYKKLVFQPITIIDFATYYNISQESIIEVMKSNDQLKNQQVEAVKQEKKAAVATQKIIDEAKKQELLEKLERMENQPKRFSYKSN
jgi:hypothetical protein